MVEPQPKAPRADNRGRIWLFRAVAILAGLAPFALAEGLLRALDLGRPDLSSDPFVGFSDRWPLFVRDATGERYEIPPAHFKFFRPASFGAVKPPGEFRIFCLGGSTVQGRPFATETAFPAWLEISLNALDASRRWKAINCGGVSYASYRLVPVLKEVLGYAPDLVVLYTGHNEFLEERTYAAVKRIPGPLKGPLELASRLRVFHVLYSGLGGAGRPPSPSAILGPEVDALLDYRGGLAAYHRDDAQRCATISHYEWNVRRMIALCRAVNVPVVLINPVANLDSPPFKSEHRADLSPADLARFNALWGEARTRYREGLATAVPWLEEASAIDGRHAGLHYALAKCYEGLRRLPDARRELERARDEDVCPLRIVGPMRQALRDVAQDTGTPLLDAEELFSTKSARGIPGDGWLVDHVHPSIAGHRLLADALMWLLAREGMTRPDTARLEERARRYRAHEQSLDDAYYAVGQRRLGNLRLWAQGRGNRIRPPADDDSNVPVNTPGNGESRSIESTAGRNVGASG